jgi:hypothetical protein
MAGVVVPVKAGRVSDEVMTTLGGCGFGTSAANHNKQRPVVVQQTRYTHGH